MPEEARARAIALAEKLHESWEAGGYDADVDVATEVDFRVVYDAMQRFNASHTRWDVTVHLNWHPKLKIVFRKRGR
jgi:hypothetical protein